MLHLQLLPQNQLPNSAVCKSYCSYHTTSYQKTTYVIAIVVTTKIYQAARYVTPNVVASQTVTNHKLC
jgi:hypothetical protein